MMERMKIARYALICVFAVILVNSFKLSLKWRFIRIYCTVFKTIAKERLFPRDFLIFLLLYGVLCYILKGYRGLSRML